MLRAQREHAEPHGLPVRVEVGRAVAAEAEVALEDLPALGLERAVDVLVQELDELAAGELAVQVPGLAARRALRAVPLDRGALLGAGIGVEVGPEGLLELGAVHACTSFSRGSSRLRSAWRARCTRTFAAFTVSPSSRATSSWLQPSMSRRTSGMR